MRKFLILVIVLFYSLADFAFDADSLRQALNRLTVAEQLYQINNIPYDIMVQNNQLLIPVFGEYITIARKNRSISELAQLYSRRGTLYYYNGQYDQSVLCAQKAIHLLDSLGLKSELGNVYGELGYQMKRRDLSRAFEYMKIGKDILEETGDSLLLSKIYDNLGVLYEMDNKPNEALTYYRKAIILKRARGDSLGIPYTYNKFFTAFLLLNNTDSAQHYLNLSTIIRENRHDIIGLAENYSLYGDLFIVINELDKSVQSYFKSLDYLQNSKYPYLTQYNYSRLSEVYERKNDFSNALLYFKKSSQYNDSLLNEKTNAAIASLEVQFDSEKKEKELAQKKSDLTGKQLELKQRNFLLIIVILVLFFVVLGSIENYRKFRFRRKKLQEEALLKEEIAEIKLKNDIQEERLRISKDLHDNIGSQLTFIISSLDLANYGSNKQDIKYVSNKLNEIRNFSASTIEEFRDTIWALSKESISLSDLELKVSSFISKAKSLIPNIKFETQFKSKQNLDMDSEKGINIFRIIQESVNNAIKHSDAGKITITITDKDNAIVIMINDDGKGFDMEQLERKNGLRTMEERAKKAGAEFKIITKEKGTQISVSLGSSE